MSFVDPESSIIMLINIVDYYGGNYASEYFVIIQCSGSSQLSKFYQTSVMTMLILRLSNFVIH